MAALPLQESPYKRITSFLVWYRLATIVLVVLLNILTPKAIPAWGLVFAVLYNATLLVLRATFIDIFRRYRIILLLDFLIVFILLSSSGGYKSPYFLYSFSPLILGSFIHGYRTATVLASVQSVLYFEAIRVGGYRLANIAGTGEHPITDVFFFFLVGMSAAYFSYLLGNLKAANERQSKLDREFEDTSRYLELSLRFNQLSKRELQVLDSIVTGRTMAQVAIELGISIGTVKTYLARTYRKLGVSSKQEAILKALSRE